MRGGYLRVMYPAPENCLNLPAWKEFYGFDQTGQNAWMDIALDEKTGKAVSALLSRLSFPLIILLYN